MGFASPVTLHVDKPDMLPMFMFMPAVAEEPMRRETANRKIEVRINRDTQGEPVITRVHGAKSGKVS